MDIGQQWAQGRPGGTVGTEEPNNSRHKGSGRTANTEEQWNSRHRNSRHKGIVGTEEQRNTRHRGALGTEEQ